MSRDLVLGLDGGGTKTVVALVARDGTVAALRQGPGLDPYGNARLAARSRRHWSTGVGPEQGGLERAVLGLSCHTETADVSAAQIDCAKELFTVPVDVLNDVHVAFEGALAGRAGRAGAGRHGLDDLGGRRAGAASPLRRLGRHRGRRGERLLARPRGPDRDDPGARRPKPRHTPSPKACWPASASKPATCSPGPSACGSGAPASRLWRGSSTGSPRPAIRRRVHLLTRAADHLVEQVETAWRLVGSPGPLVWSYAGGLFASGGLRRHLAERLGPAQAPELPPVGGAVLEAARRAGWTTDGAWRARLAESLAHGIRSGGTPDLSRQGWTA